MLRQGFGSGGWEALSRSVFVKGWVNWHLVAPKWQIWLYRDKQVIRLGAGAAAGSTDTSCTHTHTAETPQSNHTLHMEMLFPLSCIKPPVIHSCSFFSCQAQFYSPLSTPIYSFVFKLYRSTLFNLPSHKKWFFCYSLDPFLFYILLISWTWGSGETEALLNSRVNKGI